MPMPHHAVPDCERGALDQVQRGGVEFEPTRCVDRDIHAGHVGCRAELHGGLVLAGEQRELRLPLQHEMHAVAGLDIGEDDAARLPVAEARVDHPGGQGLVQDRIRTHRDAGAIGLQRVGLQHADVLEPGREAEALLRGHPGGGRGLGGHVPALDGVVAPVGFQPDGDMGGAVPYSRLRPGAFGRDRRGGEQSGQQKEAQERHGWRPVSSRMRELAACHGSARP